MPDSQIMRMGNHNLFIHILEGMRYSGFILIMLIFQ